MSNLMGKLADRASIMKSAFSDVETAVIKGTKHNTKTPKEKHVRRLVVLTHDEPHRIPELIAMLAKRLEYPDWLVVMKTLNVFHRLMRDGNLQVVNELRYKSNIFNLRKFADTTSPEAHHQSIFVRKYSQYLEEKVLVYKILSVEFEKDASVTKTYTTEEAFERIPRLQSQMNALLNCRASKDHLNNSIIVSAFGMLLKDSFKLYKALNDGIINLLEHYFNMPKDQAQRALDIYKLFAKETDGIIQFYDIARKISKTDLPELQHAPTTLVEALENYIKDLDEGRSGTQTQQDKQNIEKFRGVQSHMGKFEFFEVDDAHRGNDDSDSDSDSRGKYNSPNPPKATIGGGQNKPSPALPPKQPAQQAPPPQLFDPFDFEPTPASKPQNSAAPFDPFGPSTDFFSQGSPQPAQAQSFDPFGNSAQPAQPTRTADPFGSQPANNSNFFDFPANNQQPSFSPNQQQQQQHQGGGSFSSMHNAFNPMGQHQQQQGFGQQNQGFAQQNQFGNQGFGQQNQGFGGSTSPQPQQKQFQPVTQTNSNPFLSDNGNPFG